MVKKEKQAEYVSVFWQKVYIAISWHLKRYDQFLVIAFNSVPLIYVSTKYTFTIFLGDIKCIEEKKDTLKFRKNVLVDYYH